jgi:hypothetical protein
MSGLTDFTASVQRFHAEADGAVMRARRASEDARATSKEFRRETRQLESELRERKTALTEDEKTSDNLRLAAESFRKDNGLPIAQVSVGEDATIPGTTPVKPNDATANLKKPGYRFIEDEWDDDY